MSESYRQKDIVIRNLAINIAHDLSKLESDVDWVVLAPCRTSYYQNPCRIAEVQGDNNTQ